MKAVGVAGMGRWCFVSKVAGLLICGANGDRFVNLVSNIASLAICAESRAFGWFFACQY